MLDNKGKEIKTEVFTVQANASEKYETEVKKSFFHIDRDMIRFKAHFFLYIGAMGTVNPFIPVVARNKLGLSATSLAAVLTFQQLFTVISKPIIGYIADYFNRLKLIINSLIVIQTLSLFLILAIPPIKKPSISRLSSSIDQFKNFNEQSDLIILTAKYCPKDDKLHIFNSIEREKVVIIQSGKCLDIMCLKQVTDYDMHCFRKDTEEKIVDLVFDTKLNCSCSVLQFTSKNFTDDIQTYQGKEFYHLSSIEPAINYSENYKSYPCVLELSKSNDSSPEISDISDFETLEFWMFALATTISMICISSIITLADTACNESLQKFGGDFGRQRLFGAIGWGSLAAIGGLLCDLTHDYQAAWILMAILQILTIWNISQLDLVKPHFSQNILKDIGRVLNFIEFLAFELGTFFNGLGFGILLFYLIWFLASLNASKFLCGLTQYVECFVGEIPLMFVSGWFIKKLGHFNLLSISLLCYTIRFFWYSYLHNPWLVLPIEILHGFTYGTFFPTVASYGKLNAKPGTEATTLSILATTHDGLGAGLGCLLAGIGFDLLGGHETFFYFSIFCGCATLINIVNTYLLKGRNTKKLNIAKVVSNNK